MNRRWCAVVSGAVMIAAVFVGGELSANPCARDFAYGQAGFGGGYGMACRSWDGSWGGVGGWCGPRWNWNGCGPRWGWNGCGPCLPRCGWSAPWSWGIPCRPWYGGWRGFPGWGGCGWRGSTFRINESIWLSVPAGGGATFFSGGIRPYPQWIPWWGVPCNPVGAAWAVPWGAGAVPFGAAVPAATVPTFGPAGVLPFLGVPAASVRPAAPAMNRPAPAPALVAGGAGVAGRPALVRASNAIVRARAARQVAIGDRILRDAGDDPSRVSAALEYYRRAAAMAQDQPDTFVRQAIALVALGRHELADRAVARAVEIDGRLGDDGRAGRGAASDPVFGDRLAGEPRPLAARGTAILREAGLAAGSTRGGPTWIADRWAARWTGPPAAVAQAAR